METGHICFGTETTILTHRDIDRSGKLPIRPNVTQFTHGLEVVW
jgi:hypothetical protein